MGDASILCTIYTTVLMDRRLLCTVYASVYSVVFVESTKRVHGACLHKKPGWWRNMRDSNTDGALHGACRVVFFLAVRVSGVGVLTITCGFGLLFSDSCGRLSSVIAICYVSTM